MELGVPAFDEHDADSVNLVQFELKTDGQLLVSRVSRNEGRCDVTNSDFDLSTLV